MLLACRSVWRASPGHARLHARWDASIWAGSSHGAALPGRPSHGHEAARHVSGRTLLKQQSRRHHIRFEVHTFLSSLCFLKQAAAAAATQQPDLVAAKSNLYSLEHTMDIKCNFLIGKRERERERKGSLNTTCDPEIYSVVILLNCEDVFPPIGFTQVNRNEVCFKWFMISFEAAGVSWTYQLLSKGKFLL